MLSGVKFIPRDQIDKDNSNVKGKKSRSSSGKDKHRRRKKGSGYSSSDDDLDRIRKDSRRNKKWYSSEENSSSYSSESEDSSDRDEKKDQSKKKNKRRNDDSSEEGNSDKTKNKSKKGRKLYSREQYSSFDSEDKHRKGSTSDGKKRSKEKRGEKGILGNNISESRGSDPLKEKESARKEMGLDWMLRPADKTDKRPIVTVESQREETSAEEVIKVNSRELNPYLRENGGGYPEEADEKNAYRDQLLPSSVVGDGGASWRLKALKRAQEQASREGQNLEKVVEERWGSLGQLALSAASGKAAPSRAHLHAINNRKKRLMEGSQTIVPNESETDIDKKTGRDYLRDVSVRHPKLRAPKVNDSLSWRKQKSHNMSSQDADLIYTAVSSLNKFSNDGSFMQGVLQQQGDCGVAVSLETNHEELLEPKVVSSGANKLNEANVVALSANQLVAKALQLRMKGKHEEAEKFLQEAENMKTKQGDGDNSSRPQNIAIPSRYIIQDLSVRKKKEEDADLHLAKKIMENKTFNISSQADDEYDYGDGPSRKSRKKGGSNDLKASEKNNFANLILTQQKRCLFCFENPKRPRHLVVSIANFTYLMLPPWQPVVPGHCFILPMQHESATRNVDNGVWEEIRNFKKCLIMMFSKQEKELVFLETVMELAQQRRHCLIECIPLPREIAKQAPLYFKKAIDEAEDEWSQHNAKKLIDTSDKGLRGSIPKDFPYFHVEFGLSKGFVHVIDDEKQFKSSLGLNVIRGMLHLQEEDMYRRRRHEEGQRHAVASFARDWEPFDWTKQL
ncbi:CwfJ_C_2 domain-containing protein/CwfJ_C_1 domain-containing protein [Cephalotus follicularis]|uniref:CwfJ_C_2 domain-containing protein/CwfJ_C_1 domain-containing protein n=1 Tax=Cephalotus follicularis TaxID=3775 RepID=A0A1Q3BTC1_CEPFO|nr:CwfJ_C_2 domain-containing protein/CwfJ_C_1 domain-containing protein [Cephalotus follicularis]